MNRTSLLKGLSFQWRKRTRWQTPAKLLRAVTESQRMVPTGKATSMSPEKGKYILLKDGSQKRWHLTLILTNEWCLGEMSQAEGAACSKASWWLLSASVSSAYPLASESWSLLPAHAMQTQGPRPPSHSLAAPRTSPRLSFHIWVVPFPSKVLNP